MNKTLIAVRLDGFAVEVTVVDGQKICAKVAKKARVRGGKDSAELVVEMSDPLVAQEFDMSGLDWQSRSNEELLTEWIRKRIQDIDTGAENWADWFKKKQSFAQSIVRLAQDIAASQATVR